MILTGMMWPMAHSFTGIRPARTTVQSVLSDGIKIEIDAIAVIG
jgi:2-iminobutanoate/2-iminopropanoate deaminase